MISEFPALSNLPPGDKILLAAELFDQATVESEELTTDPAILDAVEDRLDHYRKNPDTGLTWEEVKRRARSND